MQLLLQSLFNREGTSASDPQGLDGGRCQQHSLQERQAIRFRLSTQPELLCGMALRLRITPDRTSYRPGDVLAAVVEVHLMPDLRHWHSWRTPTTHLHRRCKERHACCRLSLSLWQARFRQQRHTWKHCSLSSALSSGWT